MEFACASIADRLLGSMNFGRRKNFDLTHFGRNEEGRIERFADNGEPKNYLEKNPMCSFFGLSSPSFVANCHNRAKPGVTEQTYCPSPSLGPSQSSVAGKSQWYKVTQGSIPAHQCEKMLAEVIRKHFAC